MLLKERKHNHKLMKSRKGNCPSQSNSKWNLSKIITKRIWELILPKNQTSKSHRICHSLLHKKKRRKIVRQNPRKMQLVMPKKQSIWMIIWMSQKGKKIYSVSNKLKSKPFFISLSTKLNNKKLLLRELKTVFEHIIYQNTFRYF